MEFCVKVNGRLVLEGVLRICWGVEHSIRIKEFDDKRLIAKRSFKGKCDNRFHLITSKSYLSFSWGCYALEIYSFLLDSEKGNLTNCDNPSPASTTNDEDLNKTEFTSQDTSLNNASNIVENKVSDCAKRNDKKSIAFNRHSVHQINISNKVTLNWSNIGRFEI